MNSHLNLTSCLATNYYFKPIRYQGFYCFLNLLPTQLSTCILIMEADTFARGSCNVILGSFSLHHHLLKKKKANIVLA